MRRLLSILLSLELVYSWAMSCAFGATSQGVSSLPSSVSTIESGFGEQSREGGGRGRTVGGGVKFQNSGSDFFTGIFFELERKKLDAIFLHTGISFLRITDKMQKKGVMDGELFTGYTFSADNYIVTPYVGLNYLGSENQSGDSDDVNIAVGGKYRNDYLMGVMGIRAEKELETYLRWGVDTKLERSIMSRFDGEKRRRATLFQIDVPISYIYAQNIFSFVPTYRLLQKKGLYSSSFDGVRRNEVSLSIGYYYQFQ